MMRHNYLGIFMTAGFCLYMAISVPAGAKILHSDDVPASYSHRIS